MRRTDLLEIIQNGENAGIEFKRDGIRQEQIRYCVNTIKEMKHGNYNNCG